MVKAWASDAHYLETVHRDSVKTMYSALWLYYCGFADDLRTVKYHVIST